MFVGKKFQRVSSSNAIIFGRIFWQNEAYQPKVKKTEVVAIKKSFLLMYDTSLYDDREQNYEIYA